MRDEKRVKEIKAEVEKKGYVEIYSGVYVEKGEDIKENVSDEEKSLYEDNEVYCYTNDGKCEIFDEYFEFLDEDYEEDDE